jgi:hypothetical protein
MPVENIPLPSSRLQTALRPFIYDGPPVFERYQPPAATLPVRIVCGIAAQITTEMVMIAGSRALERRDRRRALCHVRQIAMYACHTGLQLPHQDIASAFGCHRSSVSHACEIVERRRENPAFNDFVAAVERAVNSVFRVTEVLAHG